MTLPRPHTAVLQRLDALLANVSGKRVGVFGLGIAGRAMAAHLVRRGARVVGIDKKGDAAALPGVTLALGEPTAATFADLELLVLSPGVDPRQPLIQAMLERGVPVIGELELVGKLPGRVAAITGTNGKSTTTALLGALVSACGQRAFVGGNYGEPVASFLDRGEAADVLVLELSSFQLETAYRFRADVAVVLNVTPDHMDRYDSVPAYAQAKARLVENLRPDDVAVLSYDDPYVRAMSKTTRARVLWLSTREATLPGDGAVLRGDTLVPTGSLTKLGEIDLRHPRLLGRHNRENALAALLAAHALGFSDVAALLRGYRGFAGLEHRLELVGEVGGVRYINDSKATNDDAAAIAVNALQGPLVLLLGGRSKGGGYAALQRALGDKARELIVYGEAREEIALAFKTFPRLTVVRDFAAAFDAAVACAKPGDTVLLSPACSSYDGFKDYTERGRTFKAGVQALAGGQS